MVAASVRRELTDGAKTVTYTFTYDVFGAVRTRTGTSANEFTYTGEQNDSSGLEYLRARYYDPAVGRFTARDPLELVQRYAYVDDGIPAQLAFIRAIGELGIGQAHRLLNANELGLLLEVPDVYLLLREVAGAVK